MKTGSFMFKWEHPADEVYVTGTFDDWSKSERLEKTNNVFTKEVFLPVASDKIYYKFVVDGNWVTDHTAPQENDESGNLNNVLTSDKITISSPDSVDIMSEITTDPTTVPLAGAVSLVKDQNYEPATLPGSFPVTPVEKMESEITSKPDSLKDSSLPQTALDTKTLRSNLDHTDELGMKSQNKINDEQTFSISPLPAFPGAVNPISIAPGQELPDISTLTPNTLTSTVDLRDEKSRQRDNLTNQFSATNLKSTSQNENDVNNTKSHYLSETPENTETVSILPMKPEVVEPSSIFPSIQSVGPQSTTAALAAEVPVNNALKQEPKKSPDFKTVDTEKEPDSQNTNSNAVDKAARDGSTLDSVSLSTESKLPTSSIGLNLTSVDQLPITDNSILDVANTGPEVIKDSVVNTVQSPEALSDEKAVLAKNETENEPVTEKDVEDLTIGTSPTTAPQISVESAQIPAERPCTVTTAEATKTDQKSSAPVSPRDDSACKSTTFNQNTSGNNDVTNNDKTDNKKKKRLSIFSKLKAKLIPKDKD